MPSFPSRCQHIKVNGTQCGSPAMRRHRFCFYHHHHHAERIEFNADRARAARRRKITIDLPVLEDAESIQVSLTQIMRLIISGQIDPKTAGLLLYALQTASANLSRAKFEPYRYDVILDPRKVAETQLDGHVWKDSDFEEEDDDEEEVHDPAEAARHRGIMKAAEYLYELDRKKGGAPEFVPKSEQQPSPNPAKPKPAQSVAPAKTTKEEGSLAAVRARITAQVKKAMPDLIAANPELAKPSGA